MLPLRTTEAKPFRPALHGTACDSGCKEKFLPKDSGQTLLYGRHTGSVIHVTVLTFLLRSYLEKGPIQWIEDSSHALEISRPKWTERCRLSCGSVWVSSAATEIAVFVKLMRILQLLSVGTWWSTAVTASAQHFMRQKRADPDKTQNGFRRI